MRISDWSSDVCSSDLLAALADRLQRCGNEGADRRGYDRGIQLFGRQVGRPARPAAPQRQRALLPALVAFLREGIDFAPLPGDDLREDMQIGKASCRERGCQYVTISVAAGSIKNKKK